MIDKNNLKKAFLVQAETCNETSLLYHDMLTVFGNNETFMDFFYEIFQKREIGKIEAILTFISFFHYNCLTEKEDFKQLGDFFESLGGNYQKENYSELENILINLFEKYKNDIEKWYLNTRLQTNEIARCAAVYPAVLSLGLDKINLIELGCSAGLVMLMDLYSYNFHNEKESFKVNNENPVLNIKSNSIDKLKDIFKQKTQIVKRIGLDLFPLNLNDEHNTTFLKSVLWDDIERKKRMEESIETFQKFNNKVNMDLLQCSYTEDLVENLKSYINKEADIVFYSSVTTYQIPKEAHDLLILRLKEFSEFIGKKIYYIEFESGRFGHLKEEKNVTDEEGFHITINTFPDEKSYEFGRAHHHGKSVTIF